MARKAGGDVVGQDAAKPEAAAGQAGRKMIHLDGPSPFGARTRLAKPAQTNQSTQSICLLGGGLTTGLLPGGHVGEDGA